MHKELSQSFREMAVTILRKGSIISFRAQGSSMSPFIRDSETVIIEPPTGRLRIGDVILFAGGTQQQFKLHRIVKKTAEGYVTRGDAACIHDGPVSDGAVLGRVVHVVGGLNFHLRFPLNALAAHTLGLRKWPLLFSLLRIPGRLMLRSLRLSHANRNFRAQPD